MKLAGKRANRLLFIEYIFNYRYMIKITEHVDLHVLEDKRIL